MQNIEDTVLQENLCEVFNGNLREKKECFEKFIKDNFQKYTQKM